MGIVTTDRIYQHNDLSLKGYLALPANVSVPVPAILIVHDWSGCNDFAKEQARNFAKQGYIGFAVDMYGEGRVGHTNEEKQHLMNPLINQRNLLKERMQVAFSELCGMKEVKQTSIAAIGFCFGGLCVLDLARTGASLKAAVSFHGLLHRDLNAESRPIKASILALHGYDDPMVKLKQIEEFAEEMTQWATQWEICMYGHTAHAFTNPQAQQPDIGLQYQPKIAHKAFRAMHNLFEDTL